MNLNRIIDIVVRVVVVRAMHLLIDGAFSRFSRRSAGKEADGTDGDGKQIDGERLKQSARMMRRIGR